jgi:hypothetical protein
VYIHDKIHAWLPAKVIEYQVLGAVVAVALLESWIDSTVNGGEASENTLGLHPSLKSVDLKDLFIIQQETPRIPPATLRWIRYKDYPDGRLPVQAQG